jgi:hypothetical protein
MLGNLMTFYRILGTFFLLIGIIGFFTVADDLRHSGELIGVGSVLMAGVILIISQSSWSTNRYLRLQWIAFGLLAGSILGAGLDNMLLGVGLGIAVGIMVTVLAANRRARALHS